MKNHKRDGERPLVHCKHWRIMALAAMYWRNATALLLAVLSSVNARDLFLFAGQSNMEGWSNWKGGVDWKYLDRALFDDVA